MTFLADQLRALADRPSADSSARLRALAVQVQRMETQLDELVDEASALQQITALEARLRVWRERYS